MVSFARSIVVMETRAQTSSVAVSVKLANVDCIRVLAMLPIANVIQIFVEHVVHAVIRRMHPLVTDKGVVMITLAWGGELIRWLPNLSSRRLDGASLQSMH
jgi:hypothetical protein